MLVQVRGLAEAFPTLEAGIGLLSRVNPDVFLAVSESKKSFAADFTGIFSSSLHHQDVVLRQGLFALGQDIG